MVWYLMLDATAVAQFSSFNEAQGWLDTQPDPVPMPTQLGDGTDKIIMIPKGNLEIEFVPMCCSCGQWEVKQVGQQCLQCMLENGGDRE